MAHKHDAAATGALQILGRRGIGHIDGIESFSFVGNNHFELLLGYLESDTNLSRRVHLVAVFNSVDQSLLDGQANAKNIALAELMDFEEMFDLLLNATGFHGVARDQQVGGEALL